MSLHDCPECQHPISTAATACPHCGCPLRGGKKKRSYLAELLLLLALVSIVGIFYDKEDPTTRAQRATLAEPAPRCDAKKAGEIVRAFLSGGLLLKVEPANQVSRVYVLEPWKVMTIDDKQTADNALQCYLTNGGGHGPTIVVYHDGRSGKELATSNQYGFRMD